MKRENLEQYIIDNKLLQSMPYGKPGIYAITIDFYGKHRNKNQEQEERIRKRGAPALIFSSSWRVSEANAI